MKVRGAYCLAYIAVQNRVWGECSYDDTLVSFIAEKRTGGAKGEGEKKWRESEINSRYAETSSGQPEHVY